jgi:hypothetical protein
MSSIYLTKSSIRRPLLASPGVQSGCTIRIKLMVAHADAHALVTTIASINAFCGKYSCQ